MSAFDTIGNNLERTLGPLSQRLGNSKLVQVMAAGMTMFLPVTVGGALFSMLANFPLPQVTGFFESLGLLSVFQSIADVTINLMALYVAFGIAYRYAQSEGKNPAIAGLFSVGTLLALMPHTVGEGEAAVAALDLSYLGSKGIFVAMIGGMLVGALYSWLMGNDRLVIKLPDSVPEMVSQSLSPLVVGILVFAAVAAFQALLGAFTTMNVFDLVNTVIAAPVLSLGDSPYAVIALSVLANLLFFVGVHPASVLSAITPVLIPVIMKSMEEFAAGQALSSLETLATYATMTVGGTGSTLALVIIMFCFAKSERYKTMGRIALIPNIMNINEPVIFGMPVVMNAVLLVPFVLAGLLCPLAGLITVKLGIVTSINPAVLLALPFTTPVPITALLAGGVPWFVLDLLLIVLTGLLYYPFFKVLDNQALAEEQGTSAAAE